MKDTYTCRICYNDQQNLVYPVREMMFGTREEFEYFECEECGCLQITDFPTNMEKYYPVDYFSFAVDANLAKNRLRQFIDPKRVRFFYSGKGLIGRLASWMSKPLDYLTWLANAGCGPEARILDVGCGQGQLLLRLKLGGFNDCLGIDPFIRQDILYPNGLRILKSDITALARTHGRKFDLIMLHHSFEHMAEPDRLFAEATGLLEPGGCLLLRIPVADSYAWQHYRQDWFALEAPRHFFLHTRKSMEILAWRHQLAISKIVCDSTPAALLVSELYRRDIAGNADRGRKKIFSRVALRNFRKKNEELNRNGQADNAAYYLHYRPE